MKQSIAKLAKARGKNVIVECVDVQVGNKIDLSYAKVRQKYFDAITSGVYHAILLSPPCSTFSRACWRNFKGPRPVRDFRHPRGLQFLTAIERRKCNLGNTFADFTWEIVGLAAEIDSIAFLAFENPEDLGSIGYGPRKGGRPASMWQWKQFRDLTATGKIDTFAIHQSDFGVKYPKPTRFVWKGTTDLPSCCKKGPPTFDTAGTYLGPLGRTPGQMQHSTGPFLTTGTEQWPPALCSWIATHLMDALETLPTTTADGEIGASSSSGPSSPYPINSPEGPAVLGGFGEPRSCPTVSGTKGFHDGGGLCSPGRWPPERRRHATDPHWDQLRHDMWEMVMDFVGGESRLEKECFHMATKGEKGCKLVADMELRQKLLDLWEKWLTERGLAVEGLCNITPGQPLRLRLLRALLEAAGDPDRGFLRQAEVGLPVGVKTPPHVFEEQVSWPLDKDSVEPALQWVPNYASVSEHLDFAKEKFEEDIAEGMMEKMTVKQFREKFGEDTPVAALAVIVEDETIGKKRMIHDASHGVRVNHRIRCRDKIRAPGAREKKTILRELRERNEVAFSVVGDISKAHRRFKHSADEHGYLACQLEAGSDRRNSDSDIIYVNRVGTFGVSCASYWWTRIAACGIRATHHLLGPLFLLELLLYADDLESIGRDRSGRMGIPLAFVFLAALGFPFKWAKTRGGFRVEWLGMETEYGSYRLGLSAKRANWLGNWL